MAVMMANYSAVDIRAELDVTQETLAQEAGLNQATISNWERGDRVRTVNARKIFHAINRIRTRKGLAPLAFDDISWRLW